MKVLLATMLYAAAALAPIRWCHSVSEFVVCALGTALLLDRYLFRWLPWSTGKNWQNPSRSPLANPKGAGKSLRMRRSQGEFPKRPNRKLIPPNRETETAYQERSREAPLSLQSLR